MSKFLKSARSGYVIVLLAFLLPVLVASIYFAINFTERTAIYSHKDCSADAALAAIKNYNFGAPFEAQKLGLLSKADNVYNDKAVMHSDDAIKHEELVITPNCFSVVPTDSNVTEFNQFVGLYSSIDMSYRQGFFYDENYIENAKYLASECKVLDASIPNTGINLACNCVLPADEGFDGYCNAYPNSDEHRDGMKFTFNKNGHTTQKTISLSRRVADTDKLTIQKDGDSLVVNIKDDLSGKTYSAKAIPAKCNVDIVMCIPTNGAACNENNLDLASVATGDTTGLPLHVEPGETSPSTNVKNTPIYQISQACKKFIKDNFMATQGVCAGIVPYSGKMSIPHYRFESWGCYQQHFNDTNYMLYANTNDVLRTKIMGYYLYGSCGDPTKILHYGNVWDSTCGTVAKGVLNTWHKYGVNVRHQQGILLPNTKIDGNYDYDIDISSIEEFRSTQAAGYLLSSLYPAYLGYANVLRGRADEGSIDYLPNPYYVIELTPDMVKICDLLECFRPINDEYSCSNFLFLPFYWSNAILNYKWKNDSEWDAKNVASTDPARETDANYFSQESKLTEGRSKAVILFVNKPDHFEPGEMTYLGFSNDNQEFDLAESDTILFNIDYSSNAYKFYDGTTLGSVCKTTSPNVELYGQKKILKFKQTSGTMVKIPEGTSSTDSQYASDFFWKVPENSVTTAKLSCPQKHLIKLVFEGNYLNEAIKENAGGSSTVTFYSDIVKEYPSDNTNKHITDCRIDSTDGESVPLDTPYEISKPTTFVFSGPTAMLEMQAGNVEELGNTAIDGPNFRGNLSQYKVKYSFVNSKIQNILLKNQIIRIDIGSQYYLYTIPVLILNNGKIAKRLLAALGVSNRSTDPYCLYGNTSTDGTVTIIFDGVYAGCSWSDLFTISQDKNTNFRNVLKLFSDNCVSMCDNDIFSFKIYSTATYASMEVRAPSYINRNIYGINSPFYSYIRQGTSWNDSSVKLSFASEDNSVESKYEIQGTSLAMMKTLIEDAVTTGEYINYVAEAINTSYFDYWRLQNTIDKTLLSTDFVDKETLDEAMRKNTGVCLYKLTESEVNERGIAISPGNYICFQGDGELHVTVEPGTSTPAQGLYLSNLKDRSHVTVVDHGSSLRPNRKVVYIDPQAIADNVDEDGNYHVDLMMNNVKLISAELTNRPYTKEDPKITITETATKADDIVTEGENYKKTEPGDTTTTYQIIANDSRPIMVTVDKSMCKTRVEEPYGTVNFSSKNGVSDCKTASGETVPLDTDYKFAGETEFVFSGGNFCPVGGSYAVPSSYTGSLNFNSNMSPYKLLYSLYNCTITEAILKKQTIRDYFSCYNSTRNTPFIFADGSLGVLSGSEGHYYCNLDTCGISYGDTKIYVGRANESTSTYARATADFAKFRDKCMTILARCWWRSRYYSMYDANLFFYATIYGVSAPFKIQKFRGNDPNGFLVKEYRESGFTERWDSELSDFYDSEEFWMYSKYTHGGDLTGTYCSNGGGWCASDIDTFPNSTNPTAKPAETDRVKLRLILSGGAAPKHYIGLLVQNTIDKSLLGTESVDSTTLNEAMTKNTGICLYNLQTDLNNIITAGDYICFQGDGELHITLKPFRIDTVKTDIYRGSYTYNTKSAYQHQDMNTPYRWYNTNTGSLKSMGNSWNHEVVHGSESPVQPETFVLSPDVATYTRGQNGEYIYTITTVNAKISADFVDNTTNVYHFEKDQAPVGQRSVDFYKATENHKKDLNIVPEGVDDIVWVNGEVACNKESQVGNLFYRSNLSSMYQQERLYPDITYYNNPNYWNYSSSIATLQYNYHGDWTTQIGKIDSDYHCAIYKALTSDLYQFGTIIPGDLRIFTRVDRHTGPMHEFICDSWVWGIDATNIYERPYGGFATMKMSSYTYPKNYALTQFATKYPDYAPIDKYDQNEILKNLTTKCAKDLKAKSTATKVYVIKYRKQGSTTAFPIYSGHSSNTAAATTTISCDYSYLDSCASGSDYIYECSTQAELETIMEKIAERIKQDAGYKTPHCESVN